MTKDDLRWQSSGDDLFLEKNGKEYNIGTFHGEFLLIDIADNFRETKFKDFEDAWENLKIDGEYLHDFAENATWYNG